MLSQRCCRLYSFPLLGIATLPNTLKNYANSTIYLFLGGFLIAAGIARWGLDRRMALLTINIVGTKAQADHSWSFTDHGLFVGVGKQYCNSGNDVAYCRGLDVARAQYAW